MWVVPTLMVNAFFGLGIATLHFMWPLHSHWLCWHSSRCHGIVSRIPRPFISVLVMQYIQHCGKGSGSRDYREGLGMRIVIVLIHQLYIMIIMMGNISYLPCHGGLAWHAWSQSIHTESDSEHQIMYTHQTAVLKRSISTRHLKTLLNMAIIEWLCLSLYS